MFKRVFSRRGKGEVTRSIRITKAMDECLAKLADEYGETPSAVAALILDMYMQGLAEKGELAWPEDGEPKKKPA